MKSKQEILDKLAGSRAWYARTARLSHDSSDPVLQNTVTKFMAGIRVLEWVLDKDREEAFK